MLIFYYFFGLSGKYLDKDHKFICMATTLPKTRTEIKIEPTEPIHPKTKTNNIITIPPLSNIFTVVTTAKLTHKLPKAC